ncbi:YfbM family protein [Streptomyces sp. NPDC005500]|uniref:YfbM family protein n=1 Tax=Streptomyces sp. NPDC005500 TaxID=3155007 RepID=UPI0033BB9045
MSGLGRHFAVEAKDAELLERADDDGVMSFVEHLEECWEEPWTVDTDRAWEALHRCLSDGSLRFDGGQYPLSFAVLGGRQLYGGEDYIVAFLSADQVADVSAALAAIDECWLRVRFFALDLANYEGRGDEADFQHTWDNLVDMRTFFRSASEAGRAVLFTLGA